ncbi:MAG: formimidoylglutamate deiminase [Candidatus Xenobia bacterium]
MPVTLQADYTWIDGRLTPDVAVTIGDDGRIASVGAVSGAAERLFRRALLPGFVNAHSHAFQRALRGRTERPGPDSFWTWREQMYALVERLQPEDVQAIAAMAYLEMVQSGITAAGEFHYLHHQVDGSRYADPDELARRVRAAADEVGITLVLLRVAYARPGFGRAPEAAQKRFVDAGPEAALEAVARLRADGYHAGLAPHSVRAVPREWLRALAAGEGPLHMHVAEQPREIEECVAEYGLRPVQLLEREDVLSARFTAVHAIYVEPEEQEALGRARATVCACPTTERNLGDGVVPAASLLQRGATLSLGTDSQCQINLLEDARELELNLRLTTHRRAVLDAPDLLDAVTRGGARSLGLTTGEIRVGLTADLVAVDLDDPSVCTAWPEDVATSIVFSAERTAIREVWCRGRRVAPDVSGIVARFRHSMERIWSS